METRVHLLLLFILLLRERVHARGGVNTCAKKCALAVILQVDETNILADMRFFGDCLEQWAARPKKVPESLQELLRVFPTRLPPQKTMFLPLSWFFKFNRA